MDSVYPNKLAMTRKEDSMRIGIASILMLLVCAQERTGLCQSSTTPSDPFTLKLSLGIREGGYPKGTQTLIVRLTNMSDAWIREGSCEAGGALYKLDVLYNGKPAAEPDWIRKRREEAEADNAKSKVCEGSNPGRAISLGQSWVDYLNYLATAPGTYQFTAELKLPQVGSADSPPVRSNTITVVLTPEEIGTP